MKTRKIGFRTYLRNPEFWIYQQMKGVQIELMRNGRLAGVLLGEPEACEETWQEKLRHNKIVIHPSRREKAA